MFSAGHLQNPQDNDKRFSTQLDAEEAAVLGSYDDSVWAVWDDESGEVLAVIYQQFVYR